MGHSHVATFLAVGLGIVFFVAIVRASAMASFSR
jgi:hypothetical protein